jgi:hypothetical protein
MCYLLNSRQLALCRRSSVPFLITGMFPFPLHLAEDVISVSSLNYIEKRIVPRNEI